MAGDWLKIEKATARKPEVLRLSVLLSITPDHAFGLCFRFWSWADDNLESGHVSGVTNVTLDSVFGHAGFADALISVGWLTARNGSLSIPNFDRHLSENAKKRALSGERKRKQRSESVTEMSRSKRDKSGTREEKRREEKKETKEAAAPVEIPESLNSTVFRETLEEFRQMRKEIRKPMTPTAEKAVLKKLAAWGIEAAIVALEKSTESQWQGVFKPKPEDMPVVATSRVATDEDLLNWTPD